MARLRPREANILPAFRVPTKPSALQIGMTRLHFFKKRPAIGMHPGSGSKIRQWPIGHFAELADMFIERDGAQVILFGAEYERELVDAIRNRMKFQSELISCIGETSLDEFMTILRGLDLFIGNVSGPCHLAGALEVPTLTVWAGQVLPHEWHPLGQKTMCVRAAVPCSPCHLPLPQQCLWDLRCLKFLWPEKVYEASQEVLSLGRWSREN